MGFDTLESFRSKQAVQFVVVGLFVNNFLMNRGLAPCRQQWEMGLGSQNALLELGHGLTGLLSPHPEWAEDFHHKRFGKMCPRQSVKRMRHLLMAKYWCQVHFLFVATGQTTDGLKGRRISKQRLQSAWPEWAPLLSDILSHLPKITTVSATENLKTRQRDLHWVPLWGEVTAVKKRYVSYQRLPYFSPPAFMSRPEGSSRRTCLRGPRPECWVEGWWGPRRAQACPRPPGQSRATCSVRYCPSGYTRLLCGRFSARQAAPCFGFIHEPTFSSFCSRTEAAAVMMCCFSSALSIFCLHWSWSWHNPTWLML